MFRNYEMGAKIKGCRNFIKDAELEEEVGSETKAMLVLSKP
jgi:hypothetical protein